MRRLISRTPGGPESLEVEDLPEPKPAAGEVLIEMRACALNFPDLLLIEDRYQIKAPRPFSPGSELAGVVCAVGEGVNSLAIGDRVIGLIDWGGMAQRVLLPADNCVAMPDTMPFEDGASLVVTYATALFALQEAGLRKAETLLVLGASGGIGLATVDLGKQMGARIVAAVSSEQKAAVLRERGVDEIVVYPQGPLDRDQQRAFSGAIKAACPPGGPNVICDPVGGDYAEPAIRSLAIDGRYLVLGFTAGIPSIPLNLPLLKSTRILGISYGATAARDPAVRSRILAETIALYVHGHIRPMVTGRYPLDRGAQAFADLAGRKTCGKLVIVNDG